MRKVVEIGPAAFGLRDCGSCRLFIERDRGSERVPLALTGQSALLDREPALQRTVRMRSLYTDQLNELQIELFRRRRGVDVDQRIGDRPSTCAQRDGAVDHRDPARPLLMPQRLADVMGMNQPLNNLRLSPGLAPLPIEMPPIQIF